MALGIFQSEHLDPQRHFPSLPRLGRPASPAARVGSDGVISIFAAPASKALPARVSYRRAQAQKAKLTKRVGKRLSTAFMFT